MKGGWLWKFIAFWTNVSLQYEVLKADPNEQENSVRLGVKSLIMSISGLVTTIGFAILAYVLVAGSVGAGLAALFMLFGGIICGIVALVCFIDLLGASLMYAIYQRKLNKQKVGIAALVVSLTLIVLAIAAVIIGLMILARS